jgi:hypothetical protein
MHVLDLLAKCIDGCDAVQLLVGQLVDLKLGRLLHLLDCFGHLVGLPSVTTVRPVVCGHTRCFSDVLRSSFSASSLAICAFSRFTSSSSAALRASLSVGF